MAKKKKNEFLRKAEDELNNCFEGYNTAAHWLADIYREIDKYQRQCETWEEKEYKLSRKVKELQGKVYKLQEEIKTLNAKKNPRKEGLWVRNKDGSFVKIVLG